jgi:type II secretory pathway component PulF
VDEGPRVIEMQRPSCLPFTRTTRRKRAAFYTQLAHMLDVGIGPVRALRSLAEYRGMWRLTRAARGMIPVIQDGATLAEAMARYPNVFPENEVRMVEASQRAGNVPGALLNLARAHERVRRFWRKFITKLIYPSFILFAAWFAIPLFVATFFGDVVGVLFLKLRQTAVLAGGWLVLLTWWRFLGNVSFIKRVIHRLILGIPWLGTLARRLALARFAELFECLYSAGVRVPEAMSRAALACGNAVLASRLDAVVPMVVDGHSVTEALARSRAMPSLGLNFIEVGETTGKLDETLLKFAEYQRVDAETLLMRLATIIPLVIYLTVIFIMAVQVVSFYRHFYRSAIDGMR